MQNRSEIRVMSVDKDLDDYTHILAKAYPCLQISSEEEWKKTKDDVSKIHYHDNSSDLYKLTRDGKMVGAMRLLNMTMKMFSGTIQVGGVGYIGVSLLHKKEKVAYELVQYFLRHFKEKGVAMTMLFPFRPDFYKKMGWGYGTKMNEYHVHAFDLPNKMPKQGIAYLAIEDKQELLDCYQRVFNRTHGMIAKSQHDLASIFTEYENIIVGYRKDNKLHGYIVFSFKPASEHNIVRNDIAVKELIYETPEALGVLLSFLETQADQIDRITLSTQDEHLHHLFNNPCNEKDNLFYPCCHETNIAGIGVMYRIIDTRAFFQQLGYHNFNGVTCKLTINVIDTFFPENAGSTTIHFEAGKATVVESDEHDVAITLAVSDLSSLVMGVISVKQLHMYNQLQISHEEYLDQINRLFQAEKPICTTFF